MAAPQATAPGRRAAPLRVQREARAAPTDCPPHRPVAVRVPTPRADGRRAQATLRPIGASSPGSTCSSSPAASNRANSPSRAPNTITTPSATSRRAAKTNESADGVSATGHHRPPSAPAGTRRLRLTTTTHPPTPENDRLLHRSPNRAQPQVLRAAAPAAGRVDRRSDAARHEGRRTRGRTPPRRPSSAAPSFRRPDPRAWPRSAVLPIPASPRSTSEPLSPRPAALQQALNRCALGRSAEEPQAARSTQRSTSAGAHRRVDRRCR